MVSVGLGFIVSVTIHFAQIFAYQLQTPLDFKKAPYDSGLISPIQQISSLSNQEFTTLSHPSHPNHFVRIKQNSGSFCDESVR